MASLAGALNAPATHYRYDAQHLLVCTGTPTTSLWRYWLDGVVVNALGNDTELSWAFCGGQQVATLRNGADVVSTLLGADQTCSILMEADAEVRPQCYAPYGYLPSETAALRPAYNGEMLDSPSGCYLLGAGHHRPYSPALHCFLAADTLSPFDEGGVNAYAYCAGDPINRTDPTGHFWKWIVAGIAAFAAVASLGALAAPAIAGSAALTASAFVGAVINSAGAAVELGALAAEAAGADTAASILGWVGVGITALGVVTALPSIAAKASGQLGKKLVKLERSRKLVDSATPSGGWHTGGHLQLRDGSPLSPRPSFDGPEYMSHMPRKHSACTSRSPSTSPAVQNTPRPLLYKNLVPEAKTVLEQIRTGVPTRYPNNDGADFLNLGGYLPQAKKGNRYVEYTVRDPNSFDRGPRRLVLGGLTLTGPKNVYYSGDHYVTFRRVIFEDTMDPWYPR